MKIVLWVCWLSAAIALGSTPLAADEKPTVFVQEHPGQVVSLSLSRDGSRLMTVGYDPAPRIWDVSSGREIRKLSGHTHNVRSVAFSPDGQYALTGSEDRTLKLWEVASGREVRAFQGHTKDVRSVAFSPDGKYAVSAGGYDETARIWDIATGRNIRTLKEYLGNVSVVAFSPDGRYVLAGGMPSGSDITLWRDIVLWEAGTGRAVRTFRHFDKTASGIHALAFSPDGRYVASGHSNITTKENIALKLWEADTGRLARTWQLEGASIYSVAFSPDGRSVAAADEYGGRIGIWEVSTGRDIALRAHPYARTLAFGPDSRQVFSGGSGIKIWDAATGQETGAYQGGRTSAVYSLVLSTDGRYIIAASADDKAVKFWDASTGRLVKAWKGEESVLGVNVSPDGRHLLSRDGSGKITLWDFSTGEKVRTIPGNGDAVVFSPRGRLQSISIKRGKERAAEILDLATGEVLRTLEGDPGDIFSSKAGALSPDGRYAILGRHLFDLDTGRRLRSFDKPVTLWAGQKSLCYTADSNSLRKVLFTPDGKQVLFAGFAVPLGNPHSYVDLWDVATGEWVKKFPVRQNEEIHTAAFSPDGQRVFVGSGPDIRVFDRKTGVETTLLRGHADYIYSIAVSADGQRAFSSDGKGIIKIWDVAKAQECATLIGFADAEWIAITPTGHFDASPNGAKHLNVRIGSQVYSIDNFYETFFNPAYVASVLQGKKIEALADIRKGILPPPDVRITAPQANETIGSETIAVIVSAQDKGGGIDEIRLYHNGKAVGEDTRAVKLVSKGKEAIKTYSVALIDGINTFRAVGFSKDRTESNPYELVVHLKAPQKEISMHVIAVGINKYRNPALNLNYAVPDAKGIADFFNEKGKGLFKDVTVTNVYDENATKVNVTAKLKNLEKTNPQDVVLIYLAGHGESISDKWYFIPHELTYPEREDEVKSKGISSDEIAGLIRSIKAQKVLVIIDSCKAGAMLIAMRGFEDRKALSQLSRSTGVHVIAASTKDQFAAEVKELGHGVFTYTLLEGLKGQASAGDKTVTVRKLMTHVENYLPDITMKYRKEAQFPVVDSRGMDFPLVVTK